MSDNDEVIEIGIKLAQTIQDVIDDAEEAGCDNPFPDFKMLLNDWEAVYKKAMGNDNKKKPETIRWWYTHTEIPQPRQAVFIARKNLDGGGFHLENELFKLDYSTGRAVPIGDKTKVRKTHWKEFWWCYEGDVLAGLTCGGKS